MKNAALQFSNDFWKVGINTGALDGYGYYHYPSVAGPNKFKIVAPYIYGYSYVAQTVVSNFLTRMDFNGRVIDRKAITFGNGSTGTLSGFDVSWDFVALSGNYPANYPTDSNQYAFISILNWNSNQVWFSATFGASMYGYNCLFSLDGQSVYVACWDSTYNYLLKFGLRGNLLWQRRIARTSSSSVRQIAMDASENIYMLISSTGGITAATDIAKWNSSGTLQWRRGAVIGGSQGFDMGAMALDSSANIYIACADLTDGSTAVPHLLKYNSSGTLQWQKKLSISGSPLMTYSSLNIADDVIYSTWNDSSNTYGRYYEFDTSGAIQKEKRTASGCTGLACFPKKDLNAMYYFHSSIGSAWVKLPFDLRAPDGFTNGLSDVSETTMVTGDFSEQATTDAESAGALTITNRAFALMPLLGEPQQFVKTRYI